MKIKFLKFQKEDFPPAWARFFHAGDIWLGCLDLLKKYRDEVPWGVFYAEPFLLSFSLELFVKALVAYEEKTFTKKNQHHFTSKLIIEYQDKISVLKEIANDKSLIDIIIEYEKSVDVKYMETSVELNGDEVKLLLDIVYKLRNDMCKRTGLR